MTRCQPRIYGAEFSRKEIDDASSRGGLLSMEIEFNRDCNFNCIYCYARNGVSGKQELTAEEIRDVIDQAKKIGVKKVIILGGEPMLYPRIMEMIDFIKGLDIEIELFTNGTNITESLAKKLSEKGVVVVLKLNTSDEKLQDILAGRKGAYRQIHTALDNLKKAGYPGTVPMGISTVICRQNFNELVQLWEWLREQRISPYFEMITPQGKARENDGLSVASDKIRDLFFKLSEIDRGKYGYNWLPQPPLVGGQCLRHQFSCAVNAYGDVSPCVAVTIPVGNIREKKLADIIRDSEVIADIRNYKKLIKGPCSKCEKNDECYGCRGAAYQMTGDYLASDPLCWNNADKQDDIVRLPVNTAGLVPHKLPMLIVNRLLSVKERGSISEVEISKDTMFVSENGRLDEAAYPELIAQSIAAQDGFRKMRNGNGGSKGLLLGVKNMDILGTAHVGDKLQISVSKVAKYGGFGVIKGEIFRGDAIIARGEIKVWQDEK